MPSSRTLEAQAEGVGVTYVDEDAMVKDVASNQALDVLVLERRCNCRRFHDHVVGQDKSKEVYRAKNVRRGWGVNGNDAHRL